MKVFDIAAALGAAPRVVFLFLDVVDLVDFSYSCTYSAFNNICRQNLLGIFLLVE
jgi:hypothetical protein